MQIYYEDEQICLFDPDSWSGKTCQEPSPVGTPKARTSGSYWRKSSELKYQIYMSIDLTPGVGNLLGESYWEILSPWRGDASMLNTGVSPREEKESFLSQILQAVVPLKYYLTKTACLGILRRAYERGKELPSQLKAALEIQAGVTPPDRPVGSGAYHMNQRDEGIDLGGVSGALMATSNMQMQTFVTGEPTAFAANQRDEVRDLHNIAGALGAQPGMKQQTFIAQAEPMLCINDQGGNRMDITEEVTTTLRASMGGHQPLVSTPNCLNAWDTQQSRVFTPEGVAPTLAGADGGGGRNPAGLLFTATSPTDGDNDTPPSVLCLNDQGGAQMHCTENKTGTLRAQEHGHQPLVFENHPKDGRYNGPLPVAPTLAARMGTGGNNVPLVGNAVAYSLDSKESNSMKSSNPHSGCRETETARTIDTTNPDPSKNQGGIAILQESFCIAGNIIDRQVKNGGNGLGCQENIAYTLTATDKHAVYSRQRVDVFKDEDIASTQSARQHKDATDLVCQPTYQQTVGTIGYTDHKGVNNQFVSEDKCIVEATCLIRRLTPLECERLQGFPDGWTDIPKASDSARYKALGNSVAIPCVDYVLCGIAIVLRLSMDS